MSTDAFAPCVLHYPYQTPLHEEHGQIEREVQAWAERVGLAEGASLDRLAGINPGLLASWTFPYGPKHTVVVAGKVMAWMFVLDDEWLDNAETGGSPARMARLSVIYQRLLGCSAAWAPGSSPEGDRLLAAFASILSAIREIATDLQTRRFCTEMTRAFFGALLEACWAESGGSISAKEFSTSRLLSSGVLPMLSLIDTIGGFRIEENRLCHPDVLQLTTHATAVVAWTNDLFSFRVEEERSMYDVNLVWVLRTDNTEAATAQAVEKAISINNAEMDAYLRLEEAVAKNAGPELNSYLYGLRCWLHGNYQWSQVTSRYQTKGSQA
ncbi:hypothetical protein ACH427_27455 [Streptomyces sp. NPDC020379]|uniref:terpene synthase family protein n=1 Tax=Streptomyces sp. NPDC020379 TaxID=3365071 RepID=UPI003788BE14